MATNTLGRVNTHPYLKQISLTVVLLIGNSPGCHRVNQGVGWQNTWPILQSLRKQVLAAILTGGGVVETQIYCFSYCLDGSSNHRVD